MTCLNRVKDALLTVSKNVGHYQALKAAIPYIVWAEDGQSDAVWANDRMLGQTIQGTIDLYTRAENDPLFQAVQKALNAAEISFRLNSVQYEDDTGYIHFEWVFEVDNGDDQF